jgi:transcriptional regulator with XRE-family HTH domain
MNDYDTAGRDGTSARLALGRALREMYQRSNRTLRAVERDISISDSTLSRYFRGKAVPSWPTVEKICASFGEDPESVRYLWAGAIAERSSADFAVDDVDALSGDATAASAGADTDEATRELAARREDGDEGESSADDGRADSGSGSGGRVAGLRSRIAQVSRSRVACLVAGLVLGAVIGATATALARGGTTASAAGHLAGVGAAGSQNQAQGQGQGVPTAVATSCPWKYVVTDGNPDDIRVFDDPKRDSIIARYAPNEVFYAPEPPQIVSNMLKTDHGWIGMGNWVQRYKGGSCHTGEN